MVSLKNKQSGFTIVELLIVIIIIGILAGLVITQILGANQKARDTERKTDLNSLASQLETYFAKTGGFPEAADLNNADWRKANEINAGDNNKSLADPSGATNFTLGSSTVSANQYTYTTPTPSGGCISPTTSTGQTNTAGDNYCTSFTLTAVLENKNDTQKDPDSPANTAYYVKKSANQP